jgi:membrane protein YqaA with SNARE-associated domain
MKADPKELREIVHEVSELEHEAAPPQPAFPPLAFPEISSGKIFVFLILFYTAAFAARFLFFEGPSLLSLLKHFTKPGATVPHSGSILFDYFLYMCFACQFFPIPTLPPIAFVSKVFHPVLVSAVGAAGTCIANLNDYAILGWLFRHHRVKKVRDINMYRKLLNFFDRHAFLTLSAAAFLPIPIDVIRLLAISRAYTYWKYILAAFVGRFPRYLIIAYIGKELPAKYILILFILSTIPAVVKFASDIIKKRKNK